MAEGLPKGLITTNEALKGSIESVDRVDVEDIARLWKAYHTNRAVLAENVGRRLENFFWRIWGNDLLLKNITGTLIAAIFNKISEGGYIRTTPTQSPRSSRSLGTFDRPRQPEELYASSRPTLHPSSAGGRGTHDEGDVSDAEETETESPSSRRKQLPPRPPPVLKKAKEASPPIAHLSASDPHSIRTHRHGPRSREPEAIANPSDRSSKSTRFQTSEISSSIPRHSRGTGEAVFEESTDARSKTKQKPARRKVAVVASTIASKRRPGIRSRASQSSSTSTSIATPISSRSEPAVDVQAEISEDHDLTKQPDPDQDADRRRPAASESRSQHDVRTIPAFSSLASFVQKSSAAAAASASYQARGTMNLGQQLSSSKNVTFVRDSAGDGNLPPLPGHPPRPEGTGTMPKTKSQLTLLLQRDQKPSNDE